MLKRFAEQLGGFVGRAFPKWFRVDFLNAASEAANRATLSKRKRQVSLYAQIGVPPQTDEDVSAKPGAKVVPELVRQAYRAAIQANPVIGEIHDLRRENRALKEQARHEPARRA